MLLMRILIMDCKSLVSQSMENGYGMKEALSHASVLGVGAAAPWRSSRAVSRRWCGHPRPTRCLARMTSAFISSRGLNGMWFQMPHVRCF